MSQDLLSQLERKVSQSLEVIELLKMQIDELESENSMIKAENSQIKSENSELKTEQEKWKNDLKAIIGQFDSVEMKSENKIEEPQVEELTI